MSDNHHTVVICGSRTFDVMNPDGRTHRYPATRKAAGQWLGRQLVSLKEQHGDRLVIMAGGAKGPDTWAEKWAKREGVRFELRLPDWEGATNKKLAPLERNQSQAEEGDECVAVWDGGSRGTMHQVTCLERLGKTALIKTFDPADYDKQSKSQPNAKPEEPTVSNEPVDAEYIDEEDEQDEQPQRRKPEGDEEEERATAIATRPPTDLRDVPLDSVDNLEYALTIAKTLCRSSLVPKAIQHSPPDTLLVIVYGREYGLSPVLSTQKLFVTPDGKVGMLADTMHGLVLKSGLCDYFELIEADDEKATFETKRKGGKNEQRFTFTIEMAHKQGLTTKGHSRGKTNNWDKMPMQMLIARSKAALARLAYPDVVGGLYTYEELMDERQAEVVNLNVVPKAELAEPKDIFEQDETKAADPKRSKAAGVAPQDAEWDLDSL